MIFLVVIVAGLAIFFYSLKCLDAPITPAFRRMLSVCRLVFLGLLLYLMTRPFVTELIREPVAPVLYVALDDSRSMSYPIDPALKKSDNPSPSRWQTVIQQLNGEGIVSLWEKHGYRVRYTLFSSEPDRQNSAKTWNASIPASATPGFAQTDIGSVIARFAQTRNPGEESCLLLFTDGQWNFGQDPVSAVASLNTPLDGKLVSSPIYAFGIGTANTVFDIILDRAQLPHNARSEDPLILRLHLLVRGDLPPSPVTIRVKGESLDNEQVYYQEKTVTFPEESKDTFVEFEIPPLKVGEYLFSAEAVPLEDELLEENNRLVRGIRIRGAKDRVLMLTSAPDFEFKLLKRVLENNETIDVVSYLKNENSLTRLGDRNWIERRDSAPGDSQEQTPAPTLGELGETLDRWALIVLHNTGFGNDDLPFAQRLNEYAANGGGLLFVPGPYNKQSLPLDVSEALPSPIARLFVPEYEEAIVKIGEFGYDAFFSGLDTALPPLPLFYRIQPRQSGGKVLLKGNTAHDERVTLLTRHRYGLGYIVVASANTFWRWNMHTGNDVLSPFWLSVLYQCNPDVRADKSQLSTDGFLYQTLEPVRVLYVADDIVSHATRSGVSVTVQGPSRNEILWLSPSESRTGFFEADYTPAEPGDYSLSTASLDASVTFRVENAQTETTALQQNIDGLRALAQATGGEYANTPAWKQLASNLPITEQIRLERRTRFLGEKWWMATVMIFFLALEWFLRWRRGLP